MYVDSFILTVAPPQVDAGFRRVVLGEVSDGFFTVRELPARIEFGVYLEIGFEEDENGIFEVEVAAAVYAAGGVQESTLHRDKLDVAPAGDDWWVPRFRALPFSVTLDITTEVDLMLTVFIDGEFMADKPVLVRRLDVS